MSASPIIKRIGAALGFGALSGLTAGAAITLYKYCVKQVVQWSASGYELFHRQPLWLIPTVALMFALAYGLSAAYRWDTNLRGGGIPTALGAVQGWIVLRWLRNALMVFVLSLSAFLTGVPLGNEGPSVQIGAALGQGVSAIFGRKGHAWMRYSMTGGACAGFSTATGAPLSGVLFAIEEAHRRVSPLILITAVSAVSTARLATEILSPLLGVSVSLFPHLALRTLTVREGWIPLLVGVVGGLFAVAFLRFYRWVSDLMSQRLAKVSDHVKIFAVLLLTLLLGLCSYSFISTGHRLTEMLFEGHIAVPMLLAILLVRTVLTIGANTASITGGIFLPLLAIGATLASLLAKGVQLLPGVDHSYYSVILVLGLTACIAGMMKMPLTAIAFAVETLAATDNLLAVMLTAAIAFGIVELGGAESISDFVLERRREAMGLPHPSDQDDTILII